jgi:hypothetical protein
VFANGTTCALVARRGAFAPANGLNINDVNATPDDSEPYFISEDLGAYTGSMACNSALGVSQVFDAVALGLDNPVEFVRGEAFIAKYL